MLTILKKIATTRNLLVLLATLLFFSCQKEISNDGGGSSPVVTTPPDLSTKISSSVSGFVTDENDAAIMGATVQFGTSTITTDKYGYFEAKNVQVVKEAAVVTVNKSGYFKGIKTYMAKEGKAAFFRIKLIPKSIAGTINAASGGIVTLSNGLSVKLPAGGIVNATTNTVYAGTVNVAAYWINPTAADINKIMPGDLRGINTDGALKLLQTYGMAAVELTGASGELLQIANGQKATLTFPLPSSLSTTAPATIPLWYFDEAKGLWKEEGSAVKTGNTYVGDVGHFSYWNCDYPFPNAVNFDCTIVDAANHPIPFANVWIYYSNNQMTGCHGYTDSAGYVSGLVPGNSQLIMKVFDNTFCAVYTQSFTTTNSNISLGNVVIGSASAVNIMGTVTNCASTPVTNGYILVHQGGYFTRYPLNNLGAYNLNSISCSFPESIILVGEDVTNAQQSANVAYNITSAGNHTIANIQACGTSTQQFINYTINGTTYNFTAPADTFVYSNSNQSAIYLFGYQPNYITNVGIEMSNSGIANGSTQTLLNFEPTQISDTLMITTPILVNITEYGSIGQFTAGTFTGVFTGAPPANVQYNVSCNFRLRRTN